MFKHGPKIYGTALGSTKKEIADIKEKLSPKKIKRDDIMLGLEPTIEGMNCRDLLREYL